MPSIEYVPRTFAPASRAIIARARQICAEYAGQGYDLTLRQLYYQFVARGVIENSDRSYKRLGSIINDARLAGLLDWDYIVDRTRRPGSVAHWEDPSAIVDAVASQFRVDKWEGQPYRVEVWIEKEALAGVMERACRSLDVGWFSCRGYVSQSAMWQAAQRFTRYIDDGQAVVIVHLGDHDPSGIDMTRDIEDRVRSFVEQDYLNANPEQFDGDSVRVSAIRQAMADGLDGRDALTVRRIALNMDQVEEYNPPPNPAKLTDARAQGYIERYGRSSWELDALDPTTLGALIRDEVDAWRDDDLYTDREDVEEEHRRLLAAAADRWPEVAAFLAGDDNE